MGAFSKAQIEGVATKLGSVVESPWPNLDGCLGVLFTSRAGSSHLARELAKRFNIGRMEESLNPHLVQGIAPAEIVRSFANGWYSFKLGVPGIISAELCGVIEQYLERTYYIFLLRRDIIGQAVSLVKASQTGQWHSIHTPQRAAEYDGPKLATTVKIIANAVASLRNYIDRAERPWRHLFYEDFEHGDFSTAEAICDEFGVPRLAPGGGPKLPSLQRTADAVNESWRARFQEEMDVKTRDIIQKYGADL